MPRKNFYSVPSVAAILRDGPMLTEMAKYLIANRDFVLDETKTKWCFTESPLVISPITQLFMRIANDTKAPDDFCLVQIPTGKKDGVPEALTLKGITLDVEQLKQTSPSVAAALKTQPRIEGKIILNMTQMLRADGSFMDLTGFQNLAVRDVLSRSYFVDTKTTWMTPNIVQYVCKVYSISLAESVARWFDLDFRTQYAIATLFAFYFMCMVTEPKVAKNTLITKSKYMMLPDPMAITNTLGLARDTLGKESIDSLEDVFKVIDSFGIARIRLSRGILNTRMTLYPDKIAQAIALEYAPYFMFMVILALSGVKIGLSFRMKSSKLLRDGDAFMRDLSHILPTLKLS